MTSDAVKAAEIIESTLKGFKPKLAIVLGSGLGDLATSIEDPITVSYSELPGFHKPNVEGHSGQFVFGLLEGVPVMCLQGRAHFYEGINPKVVQTIIRTCRLVGCQTLLTTGATGSLREGCGAGNLVLLKDHINFQGVNPLVGANDSRFGDRFVGMENAYDIELRQQVLSSAQELNIPLSEGVYISAMGPSFETPAEINAFRQWGADVVGMSVVPEVIVARHCGLKVIGIALVTNLAAGLHKGVLSHEETLRGATLGAENMRALVKHFVAQQ